MSAPKLLHKYVGPNMVALENMVRGRLKFTPIDHLNDPAELVGFVREKAVRDSLDLLRQHGITECQLQALRAQAVLLNRLAPGLAKIPPPTSVEEANRILQLPVYDSPRVMEWPKLIADRFRRAVGILSLAERADDLRMWATYADVGTGWLITFQQIDQAFGDRAEAGLYEPLRANYDVHDPGLTFDPNTYLSIFVNKQPEWESEREWRIVGALEDLDQTNPVVPLMDIDPSYVFSVTAGWAVSETTFETKRKEFLRCNPNLKTARLKLNEVGRPDLPAYLSKCTLLS